MFRQAAWSSSPPGNHQSIDQEDAYAYRLCEDGVLGWPVEGSVQRRCMALLRCVHELDSPGSRQVGARKRSRGSDTRRYMFYRLLRLQGPQKCNVVLLEFVRLGELAFGRRSRDFSKVSNISIV